jgi:hypothetical protein
MQLSSYAKKDLMTKASDIKILKGGGLWAFICNSAYIIDKLLDVLYKVKYTLFADKDGLFVRPLSAM